MPWSIRSQLSQVPSYCYNFTLLFLCYAFFNTKPTKRGAFVLLYFYIAIPMLCLIQYDTNSSRCLRIALILHCYSYAMPYSIRSQLSEVPSYCLNFTLLFLCYALFNTKPTERGDFVLVKFYIAIPMLCLIQY